LKIPDFYHDYIKNYPDKTVARITAVHRDRYEISCPMGNGLAVLKKSEYRFVGEDFPATGDYVLIDFVEGG
jgi:ribosome biogenesis GTPase